MTRLIDADEFFRTFPELAIEPYVNAPTVYPICEDKACKYRANERPHGKCKDCKQYSPKSFEAINSALEALKNEPFLIDALHKAHAEIKEMERPQDKWISVYERLPEEEGDYLLWGKIDENEEDEYSFIGSYDEGCEQFGVWQEQFDSRTLGSLGSEFYAYSKVLAWRPLPKPYKEDEHGC